MKNFHFDITMDVVEYFIMNERNHISEATKLKLAFTFQIPAPQEQNFLILIIETELDIKKETINFNDFNVRLYSTVKLNGIDNPKYSNKKNTTTSFLNYLIKMNNEQILPFIEKNLLSKKTTVKLHNEIVNLNINNIEKNNIKKSYQAIFNDLLESINDIDGKTRYHSTFIPLQNTLKYYETERLFKKMNKILNKNETTQVKTKKI